MLCDYEKSEQTLTQLAKDEMPAPNLQFGASGGMTRMTLCAEWHLFALVRAFVIPPPDAKLPPR